MTIQTQMPGFADRQRMKVKLIGAEGQPVYEFPAEYLEYDGQMGYIIESGVDSFTVKGEKWKIESYSRVILMKGSTLVQLPEDCLESAEYHPICVMIG
jgi:hypothetical protein